jgi:phenylalanyl-tRNA synthetase beta chain
MRSVDPKTSKEAGVIVMLIPYSWLKSYVDIDLSPEELADRLTMTGLEVDRIDYGKPNLTTGELDTWPGIVTAEIVRLEPIKGSHHLQATRVTYGDGRELSVVCGAPNIHLHDRVPLATLGSKVGDMTIAEKKTMGVVSQGMLCSPRELGLSDDHSGIFILPPDTPIGAPLARIIGEPVIDLDIKAHRGDLFSVTGVAREVSAFSGRELRLPTTQLKEAGTPAAKLMKLEVRDPDLCPRYTSRVVRDVQIGPSPAWLAERLVLAGMRPINNVVDITNYCMLELGQPLHAFDYDKVTKHTIIVRRAHPGETLTTLDGVNRHLSNDMLLITDPTGPNVIAGIFGGERVEVDSSTTNLILEAAHFNPTSVRRTSVALGLRTESSGRFEKNPDIELTAVAIDRAAHLITEIAGGSVAIGRIDFYPESAEPREIHFLPSQVEWLTGIAVSRNECIESLQALGFGVHDAGEPPDESLIVTVPTWRGDVEESADLVEEVARIVGYDRIPATIPVGPLPEPLSIDWFAREDRIRDVLVGAGLTEIVSYSLTSRAMMARLLVVGSPGDELLLSAPVTGSPAQTGGMEIANRAPSATGPRALERIQLEAIADRLPAITLHNPPSSELESLRLTLMSGLLETVFENSKHEDTGLWFFELGRRYLPTLGLAAGTSLAQERRTLGIAIHGPLRHSWLGADRDADFYDIKGIAETLLDALKVSHYRLVPAEHPTFHPGRCAYLEIGHAVGQATGPAEAPLPVPAVPLWTTIAVLGEVHPEVADRFELPGRAYLLEIDLERLFDLVPTVVQHRAIPRYPAAERDLAIVVGDQIAAAEISEAIQASGGALVRDIQLFDVYTGPGIPEGRKSLAFALRFQSPDRTLTDQEIEQAQARILATLSRKFGAQLRS